MFEHSTLFAIMNDGTLKKFQMTNNFSNMRVFFYGLYNRYEGYHKSTYAYGYKNEYNELSYVTEFGIEQRIIDAVTDASTITDIISAANNDMQEIKYVFMGQVSQNPDRCIILFQKIQKAQVIQSGKGIKLISNRDTFDVFTENLLSILDRLDCYYMNGNLYFNNIYFARQIFDMSQYVVEATEADVNEFAGKSIFSPQSQNALRNIRNQQIRNKIKAILESGILEHHTATSIQEAARVVGMELQTETSANGNATLIIPEQPAEIKIFLKILDETIYEGLLSRELKESNSSKPYNR